MPFFGLQMYFLYLKIEMFDSKFLLISQIGIKETGLRCLWLFYVFFKRFKLLLVRM